MKKLLVMVCLFTLIGIGVAKADELSIGDSLKKIPGLKQGIGFSFKDHDFDYLTTIELAKFKGVSLEVGYSAKDEAIGVASYEIAKLKDYGVTLPILDLVELNLGGYAGYGRISVSKVISPRFDYGLSLTLITVKF